MRLFLLTMCFFMFSFIINGQTDTTKIIQKNILIDNNELNENLTDNGIPFKVVSYTVTTIINGYCYEIKVKGAKFTKAVINLIKKTKRGRKVYFEDIKVRGIDGKIVKMKPLVFKIR